MNKKNVEEELLHELFLIARQTTKIRNNFANNMSTDIYVRQIFRLGKKVFPLARDNLPGLVSNITLSAINKSKREICGKGAVRAGKRFTLFVSNENMNDIN